MSQPSVSRRIKALEAALGVALLERTTRRVKPTSIGRALDPMLRRLVCEFENCVFSLGDFGVRHPGEVTVASIATAASCFLPRVLKSFTTAHPDIRFRIVDLSAEEGLECVARGEAEFGINFLGASRSDLKFTPLIDDNFVVACRADHPFASRKSIKWSDLSGQSLIISQRSGNRALIDQALARSNLRLNWSFEVIHLVDVVRTGRSRRRNVNRSTAGAAADGESIDCDRSGVRSCRPSHGRDRRAPNRPVFARGNSVSDHAY